MLSIDMYSLVLKDIWKRVAKTVIFYFLNLYLSYFFLIQNK